MDLQLLLHAVKFNSVIRYINKLVPLFSDGLVCPPTYAARKGEPPYIAFRQAVMGAELRDVVVLDSPQSQSNRIEHALLSAHRAGHIPYPDILITFPEEIKEPDISVLQLSHRIYDAVLRTANFGHEPFFSSAIGRAIQDARPNHATALFEHAPLTLLLGGWDSNGGMVSKAAKLQRLMTSEIIGLDARPASLSATKLDVLDIRSQAAELMQSDDPVRRFEIKPQKSRGKGKKPSEFGFGNVPSTDVPRAAVISSAIQTSVLSCSGLRSLCFPSANGQVHPERDQAGHAVLAALALYGLLAQNEAGYLLRSRCELIPEADGQLELIGRTLQDVTHSRLSSDDALTLLKQAIAHAAGFDLAFRAEDLVLAADDRLVELIKRSRSAMAEDTENET
ncbi:type I-G CRISPR-associated RAMP protein Csb1/Cas7g [Azotobacter chroococcum]|uniref:CRISPR-associated protein n=1 Tax=Azotobacter chroococcum NCIMB 8003 TaxID=1328314 RepID=A0A0C4WXP0_9GAMM|nr:type I-U CRISPR-associated RAMP protein Csb1/Cas7u [Azotobacter chroococcum]AJE23687.1 CRISPR-associated protein [Azotobacter chroococcum NCIMB 8003]